MMTGNRRPTNAAAMFLTDISLPFKSEKVALERLSNFVISGWNLEPGPSVARRLYLQSGDFIPRQQMDVDVGRLVSQFDQFRVNAHLSYVLSSVGAGPFLACLCIATRL